VVVVAAVAWQASRRRALQRTFGPEYDRAVAEGPSRSAAEHELRDRERRHAELELRPLAPGERERYAQQWRAVQEQFVEDPAGAVVAGDELVTRLVAARGYPTENYDDQLAYLSVEHARPLGHYRDAHDIFLRGQRGEASTEDLRQALVHYRELFADLVGTDVVPRPTAAGRTDGVGTTGPASAAGTAGVADSSDGVSNGFAVNSSNGSTAPSPDAAARRSATDSDLEENSHA